MQTTIHEPKRATPVNPVRVKIPCTRCGSPACDRIPRNRVAKYMLPWLKLRHYRCHICSHTFYKSGSKD